MVNKSTHPMSSLCLAHLGLHSMGKISCWKEEEVRKQFSLVWRTTKYYSGNNHKRWKYLHQIQMFQSPDLQGKIWLANRVIRLMKKNRWLYVKEYNKINLPFVCIRVTGK